MSSNPIQYFVCPYSGLEAELGKQYESFRNTLNPNDSRTPKYCRITNLACIHGVSFAPSEDPSKDEEVVVGKLSPIANVSLSPHSKKKAGIPDNATRFAYLNPPPRLVNLFDYEEVLRDLNIISNLTSLGVSRPCYQKLSVALFAVFGGYIYFDKDMKVLAINALSLKATDYKLCLVGPFETPPHVTKAMLELDRLTPIKLSVMHEAGFVAKVRY